MKLFKCNKKINKKDTLVKEDIIEEQRELIDYLEEKKEEQRKEIINLHKTIDRLERKTLTSDLDYAKTCNEIEEKEYKISQLEDRVEYLEETIKKYQELPDFKNMVENVSSLASPNIDKLVEIMKDNNFENLSDLKDKMDDVIQEIHQFRHEAYDRAVRAMRF